MHRSVLLTFAAVTLSCGGTDTHNRAGLPGGEPTRAQTLRGRYLTLTQGCAGCHNRGLPNPYDERWLAGYAPGAPGQPYKVEVPGAFGAPSKTYKIYPSNLTPDIETGLGQWTPQDIFNALRTGKDRDGQLHRHLVTLDPKAS